jgi:hypothetical protein
MEDKLRRKRNLGGIYLAGTYIVLAAALYGITAYSSSVHPDDGLQWIPFAMLASPWFEINAYLLFPGLILNMLILFAVGMIVGAIQRGDFKQETPRQKVEGPKSPESPA